MLNNKSILIKRKKVVLNKNINKHTEVAIGEIRRADNDVHFVLSFGGDKEVAIIGRDEWDKFVELVINLDWDPEDTWIRPLRKQPKPVKLKKKRVTCRFD